MTDPIDIADEPDESHVWTFDIDGTISVAVDQYVRLSTALKAIGDRCVVVTGHGPAEDRAKYLDVLGFAYDSIVVVDPQSDGSGKAQALQELGSWFHFDNDAAFGPEILEICPVTFQFNPAPGDDAAEEDVTVQEDEPKRSLRDRFHSERWAQSI